MIVLIGSQKGGVGKSTMAVNVAGYLILQQKKTAIIVDADDQKSIMTWFNDRQNVEGLPQIPVVAASGKIKETLLELNRHYDYVIVDTAGRDSASTLRTAGRQSVYLAVAPFADGPGYHRLPVRDVLHRPGIQ